MNLKTITIPIALLIFFTLAGFMTGRLTAPQLSPVVSSTKPQSVEMVEKRAGGEYHFINPLWECDNFNPSRLNSIVKLRDDLNGYVQQVMSSRKAVHVSVYFRDLNSGPWLGINENERFSPASLLKVPILITVLKKCETDPFFLRKKIAFNALSTGEASPNIVDSVLIKLGNSYTVEELLFRMIAYSDNEAKGLLLQNIDNALFVKVMKDVGISVVGVTGGEDFVSVKDYSSFFRMLYNATYLSKEMSEKALQILSKTDYKAGIVAGLPGGVTVAHKFGERAFGDSNVKQLHDCGIIYRSGSPYLLCVMTRGTDFRELDPIIAEVSKIVYRDVSRPASD